MTDKEIPKYRINGNPNPSPFVLIASKDLFHELTPQACIDLVRHRLMFTPDPPSPVDLYSSSEEIERISRETIEYVAERNAVNNAIVKLIHEYEGAYYTKFVPEKIPEKKSAE